MSFLVTKSGQNFSKIFFYVGIPPFCLSLRGLVPKRTGSNKIHMNEKIPYASRLESLSLRVPPEEM